MTIQINDLEKRLKDGRIGRREFLRGATALGVSVAAATAFAGKVQAATPKKGGKLRLGLGHGSTSDTLDPATFENLYVQIVGGASQNKLTEIGNNGDLTAELAESWEPTPDAIQWRF